MLVKFRLETDHGIMLVKFRLETDHGIMLVKFGLENIAEMHETVLLLSK